MSAGFHDDGINHHRYAEHLQADSHYRFVFFTHISVFYKGGGRFPPPFRFLLRLSAAQICEIKLLSAWFFYLLRQLADARRCNLRLVVIRNWLLCLHKQIINNGYGINKILFFIFALRVAQSIFFIFFYNLLYLRALQSSSLLRGAHSSAGQGTS